LDGGFGLKNGLKSPGCKWIPAVFGRQQKEENQTFSTACIHSWKTLEQSLGFHGATRLAFDEAGAFLHFIAPRSKHDQA
jgi:hypothetical protein